jgi:hypothetical protein
VGIKTGIPVRVLFAIIVCVSSLLLLSGCGLGGAATADTTPPPTTTDVAVNPTDVDFGTVPIKTTSKIPLKLTNSGNQSLTVQKVDITGSAFAITNLALPLTISAGTTYTADVAFTPTVAGANTGSATVTTDKSNGNGKKIGLLGNGGTSQLAANPTAVSFGSLAVGKTSSKAVAITNSGTVPLKISSASVSSAAFAATDSSWVYPVSIAAGASKNLTVTYSPKTTGSATGTVTFTSDATNGASTLNLSGTATTAGQLSASPAAFPFGTITVGASATQTLALTNAGGNSVVISAMSGTDPELTITGLALPATVAAGASVNATVRFTPSSAGQVSGGFNITNDGAVSPFAIAASGTGVMPTITPAPAAFAFGSINVGATATNALTLTNNSNVSVTISQVAASGSGLSVSGFTVPITLAAGQSLAGSVSFKPTAAGTINGAVSVTSNAAALNIAVSGTGVATAPVAAITPTSVAFGNVNTGSSQSRAITIQNNGNANLVISAVSASGTGFSASGFTLPLTLAPGATANGSVSFAPTAAGSVTGSVTVTSNATSVSTSLSGTGIQPGASVTPTSIAFGNVNTGTSQTRAISIQNTGSANLVVSAVAATGTGFSVSGFTLPLTLAPGASASGSVDFGPAAAGSVTGSVTVTSNATAASSSLSGTGVQPVLAVTPTSISFGSINTAASSSQSLTLRNSGTANLTVSAVTASGAGFSVSGFVLPLTLTPGQSSVGTATFTPAGSGAASGSITVASNSAVAAAPVSLTGTGVTGAPVAAVTPTSIPFGNVNVGSISAPQTLNIKNNGTADLIISQVTAAGAGFSVSGFTLPLTLTPTQSANGSVTFAPSVSGAATGSVIFISNGNTVSASLSGAGVQPILSASPTTIVFGNVNTGSSSTQPLTLQNTGTASLTVSAITPTGAGYSVSGFTLPLTLAAGQTAAGSVVFAPTASGAVSGSVAFTSNSATATSPVTLSGTGVAPQLAMTPTSMAFGSITTGTTSTQALTLRNSGTASLSVTQLAVTGAGFSITGFTLPLTIAPGASVAGSVGFAPTTGGAVTGSVTATSNSAAAAAPVALSGTGVLATPQILVTPTSIPFGSITTGTSTSASLTLKNTGTADLNITAITPSGAGYSVSGFILPLTLTPGASAVGNVAFAPATTGTLNGSVTITSNSATAAPTVTLTGLGVAPATFLLSVSPTSLTFGSILTGNSSTLPVTLTNTGTGSVSITAGNVTGTGYTISGITFPLAMAAGATKNVNVSFAPQISGTANGSVSFVSNATNSPASVTMTGTGQAPLPHSVDISWNASTSSGVNGYHIYRSTTSGGTYSLISSGLQSGTAYTDSTVQSGLTYFYVVRAVDTTGAESTDSNMATAVIPTP